MKQNIIRFFLLAVSVALWLTFTGCETPEGGSSIPWNRPQPWERQGIPGVGY